MINNVNYKLTLVLMLGLIFKRVPLFLLQPIFGYAIKIMWQKHPGIFERLSQYSHATFIINPIDLPFVFYLKLSSINPTLKAIRRTEKFYANATISGTLENLLALFEGKIDGDAAFFSKDLVIEGSTTLVVALRNAIDSENVDIIKDLATGFGKLSTPMETSLFKALGIYQAISKDLNTLSTALLAETNQTITNHEQKIANLEDLLHNLNKKMVVSFRQPVRRKADYKPIENQELNKEITDEHL